MQTPAALSAREVDTLQDDASCRAALLWRASRFGARPTHVMFLKTSSRLLHSGRRGATPLLPAWNLRPRTHALAPDPISWQQAGTTRRQGLRALRLRLTRQTGTGLPPCSTAPPPGAAGWWPAGPCCSRQTRLRARHGTARRAALSLGLEPSSRAARGACARRNPRVPHALDVLWSPAAARTAAGWPRRKRSCALTVRVGGVVLHALHEVVRELGRDQVKGNEQPAARTTAHARPRTA